MGKKYKELKELCTWRAAGEAKLNVLFYLEVPRVVLVKLKNLAITTGYFCGKEHRWYVCNDIKNNGYQIQFGDCDNPVIEWCYLPFERES